MKFETLKNNLEFIFGKIQDYGPGFMLLAIPVVAVILISIALVYQLYLEKKQLEFWSVKKTDDKFWYKVMKVFSKYKLLDDIMANLAVKFSMLNADSQEVNKVYGAMSIVGVSLTGTLAIVYSLVVVDVWYVGLMFFVASLLFVFTIFFFVFGIARLNVLKALPVVYTALARRLREHSHVVDMLDAVKDDLQGPMKREIIKLNNVLKRNDREVIEQQFDITEKNYSNGYISLMLMLIMYVYDEGNSSGVKERFLKMSSQLKNMIDYQKTLAQTARTWMGTTVGVGVFGLFGSRWFLQRINDPTVTEYLNSTDSLQYILINIILMIVALIALYTFEKVTE